MYKPGISKISDISEISDSIVSRKYEHIFLVGEAVSTKQQWCEGAIKSVNDMYKYFV